MSNSAKSTERFETLNKLLLALGHPSRVQPLSENVNVASLILGPFPYLHPLDESELSDDETSNAMREGSMTPYALAVYYANDILESLGQESTELSDSLIFEILIPIQTQAERLGDLAELALKLNNFLPYGQFRVPSDKKPALHYELPSFETAPPIQVSVEIITTLLFFFDHLANLFEGVNSSELSIDSAISIAAERLVEADMDVQDLLEESARILRETAINI